ncbi:MAG: hypothetical protein FJ220_04470 [Kiritimatiellaceae bacterium]|nr:hypothetical protein [Kiritimatiellaceae bacterium]
MNIFKQFMGCCCVLLGMGWSTAVLANPYEVAHTVRLADPLDTEDGKPQELQLIQLFDKDKDVIGYKMQLHTDVCLERICKKIEITLYWDANGKYVKLETPPNAPLTKNDHDEFTKGDYKTLDRILKNERSRLGSYPLSSFVDAYMSNGTDAVSGATQQRAAKEIVPGAAYSTWVIWRWVHGDVTREIKRLTAQVKS